MANVNNDDAEIARRLQFEVNGLRPRRGAISYAITTVASNPQPEFPPNHDTETPAKKRKISSSKSKSDNAPPMVSKHARKTPKSTSAKSKAGNPTPKTPRLSKNERDAATAKARTDTSRQPTRKLSAKKAMSATLPTPASKSRRTSAKARKVARPSSTQNVDGLLSPASPAGADNGLIHEDATTDDDASILGSALGIDDAYEPHSDTNESDYNPNDASPPLRGVFPRDTRRSLLRFSHAGPSTSGITVHGSHEGRLGTSPRLEADTRGNSASSPISSADPIKGPSAIEAIGVTHQYPSSGAIVSIYHPQNGDGSWGAASMPPLGLQQPQSEMLRNRLPPTLNDLVDGTFKFRLTKSTARILKRKQDDRSATSEMVDDVLIGKHLLTEGLPKPYGHPPAWGSKRQQMCESLDWYRSYQGGTYSQNVLMKGMFIDSEVARKDIFGEEIIVTTIGGGRTTDEDGATVRSKDQGEAEARKVKNAMQRKQAIGVIAGVRNPKALSRLPHVFNVLAWFHVTEVWSEPVQGYKTWFMKLEKVNLAEKSWWAPGGSPLPAADRDLDALKCPQQICITCNQASKSIHANGWTCMNINCTQFYCFDHPVNEDELEYSQEFLNERTKFTGTTGELIPGLPTLKEMYEVHQTKDDQDYSWTVGVVCPVCKGCSRRIHWDKFVCEHGCGWNYKIDVKIMDVTEAIASKANSTPREYCSSGITHSTGMANQYRYEQFDFPGPNETCAGSLLVLRANGLINKQPDGPNDLFACMQENRDFKLKRRPVRLPGRPGEVLTGHYASNWGAPYKFVVAQNSTAFSEAPNVIIKALKRLTWAGQQVLNDLGEPFEGFNELLSLGYFQNDSIGYHDDGEKELGPTIATLSLGAEALMTLRLKKKYQSIGRASSNKRGTHPDMLKVVLRHGDIVIMHGVQLQRMYEHAVTPNGDRRFALTCRFVKPESLSNDMERELAHRLSMLPPGHEAFTYNGDSHLTSLHSDEAEEEDNEIPVHQRITNFVDAAILVGKYRRTDQLKLRQYFNADFVAGLQNNFGHISPATQTLATAAPQSFQGTPMFSTLALFMNPVLPPTPEPLTPATSTGSPTDIELATCAEQLTIQAVNTNYRQHETNTTLSTESVHYIAGQAHLSTPVVSSAPLAIEQELIHAAAAYAAPAQPALPQAIHEHHLEQSTHADDTIMETEMVTGPGNGVTS